MHFYASNIELCFGPVNLWFSLKLNFGGSFSTVLMLWYSTRVLQAQGNKSKTVLLLISVSLFFNIFHHRKWEIKSEIVSLLWPRGLVTISFLWHQCVSPVTLTLEFFLLIKNSSFVKIVTTVSGAVLIFHLWNWPLSGTFVFYKTSCVFRCCVHL